MDDAKLIRRLQKHSRGALETVIGQYTAYVGAVIWRTLGMDASQEDAEEIASDVFLALWAHVDELDAAQGLRPWLGTVTRNKAVDRLRQSKPTLSLPEDAAEPSPGPEELTERADGARRLWLAVDALGEPDRTLFLRHYYEGDQLSAVAHDLGMNLSTAKTKLFRGRKKLKELLTEGGEKA